MHVHEDVERNWLISQVTYCSHIAVLIAVLIAAALELPPDQCGVVVD